MRPPVNKNQIIEICPDSVNEAGDGVARIEGGFVIFCKDLLPGERGSTRIVKVSGNYAVARVMSRENSSELRRESVCPYNAKGCGGCAFAHVTDEGQRSFAKERVSGCLKRIGGFGTEGGPELPDVAQCISPEGNSFRNKTSYPFFETDGRIATGFYARASHRPVRFERGKPCPHENPLAARLREAIEEFAASRGITAYDEEKRTGELRFLTLRVSDRTGRIMAVITANSERLSHEDELVRALSEDFPELASLWICTTSGASISGSGNSILGGRFRLLSGDPQLECAIGNASFMISPESFFQVSTAGAEALYDTVYRYAGLKGGEFLLDLYCGVGTIGLYLLKRFASEKQAAIMPCLTGIEIVEAAVENAVRNAYLNGIEGCRFIAGDVPRVLGEIDPGKPDLVIIDPPRKGVDNSLVVSLRTLAPGRIVYVSCDPATLARDLKAICADGLYRVMAVQPVNMFPDTGHIESVVLLSRKNIDDHLEFVWTDNEFR